MQQTYTLEVERLHTYLVGADGAVVRAVYNAAQSLTGRRKLMDWWSARLEELTLRTEPRWIGKVTHNADFSSPYAPSATKNGVYEYTASDYETSDTSKGVKIS